MATTYKDSGVDIEAGNKSVEKIKELVKKTYNESVQSNIGHYAGAVNAKKLQNYKEPLIISSIDGVGTKMKVAVLAQKFDSVGQDLVNHSANDILCMGAEPFFFGDYIAADKLIPEVIGELVKGMAEACKNLDMPLVTGETAEMPGTYKKNEYDLAGTIIGLVDKEKVIDGSNIREGNVLVGLASNGLHTNGYSLARKVLFEKSGYTVDSKVKELGCTVGEALLKIHRCYSKQVLALREKLQINGIAHITGGGLVDNIPRIMPKGLGVEIKKNSFEILPIFKLIQKKGNVPDEDMYRTFNMGIGLVLFVTEKDAAKAIKELGEGKVIGKVVSGKGVKLV